MRAITIAIPVLIWLSLAAAAQDQGRTSPGLMSAPPAAGAATTGVPQAPVGHRQPTQGTLPPAVRSQETTGRQTGDPLGPMPKICRNC